MEKNKVLIFAGTTEGRRMAEYLAGKQVEVHVCVATAYGESLLPDTENITVSCRRMDGAQIKSFLLKYAPGYVVDATHPYAREVTENLKAACRECRIPYLRLIRETEAETGAVCVKDIREAVEYLKGTRGNILVTTGSKELELYTALPDYQERIYARVLSVKESFDKCEKLGISGRHLICMQGPFSEQLNLAMLKEYQISYLVTKESGDAGGYYEKCRAARVSGTTLLVITRPEKEEGLLLHEMCRFLQTELGLPDHRHVSLIGIGPGTDRWLTRRAEEACREAGLMIGARRMTESVNSEGKAVFTAVKPAEIISCIKEHPEYEKVAVVLSGDTGFFSGAKRLLALLEEEPQMEAEVIPGISSVAYFCARLGIAWDDAALLSLHGREANLIQAVRQNRRVLVLTDNAGGVQKAMEKLVLYGYGDLAVCIGSHLSYENEQIIRGTAKEFTDYAGGDLAVFSVEHPAGWQMPAFGTPDVCFARGDVPMTKAEIRCVSLSKMHIRRDSRIYDIGAGTGSVSVEAALLADQGQVYAIEVNKGAIGLMEENCHRHKADNVKIIEGEATEVIPKLPAADCVFVGGSKGHLKEILDLVRGKNPSARVVVNAITLETMKEVLEYVERREVLDEEIVQLSVAKSRCAGAYHMMNGQNPVYIVSFTFAGRKE